MMKRAAIIDLETNTFYLLIADVDNGTYMAICRKSDEPMEVNESQAYETSALHSTSNADKVMEHLL